VEGGEVPEDRRRRRDRTGLLRSPPGGRGFRLDTFKYTAEALIRLQNPEIIDAIPAGKGKEHERQYHLGIRPSLSGTKMEMAVDAFRDAERRGKIQIEGKARESRHARRLLFFFILVREDTLWHNRSTSLVIVCCAHFILSSLFLRANEVLALFWWWIGEDIGS
jgi:hypothetical protein